MWLCCSVEAVWLQVTDVNEFDPSLHKGLNCAAAVKLTQSAAASHPQIYKTSKELEGKYQKHQCKRCVLHRCALYAQYFDWASMWRWQLSCYLPPVINWPVVTMEMCIINEPPRTLVRTEACLSSLLISFPSRPTWSQIRSHFFSLSYWQRIFTLSGGRFMVFWKQKTSQVTGSESEVWSH